MPKAVAELSREDIEEQFPVWMEAFIEWNSDGASFTIRGLRKFIRRNYGVDATGHALSRNLKRHSKPLNIIVVGTRQCQSFRYQVSDKVEPTTTFSDL